MIAPSSTAPPHAALHDRCAGLLDAELTRLARRIPSLDDDHLKLVEASLWRVVDRLVLDRAQTHARPDDLAVLFDLEYR